MTPSELKQQDIELSLILAKLLKVEPITYMDEDVDEYLTEDSGFMFDLAAEHDLQITHSNLGGVVFVTNKEDSKDVEEIYHNHGSGLEAKQRAARHAVAKAVIAQLEKEG